MACRIKTLWMNTHTWCKNAAENKHNQTVMSVVTLGVRGGALILGGGAGWWVMGCGE